MTGEWNSDLAYIEVPAGVSIFLILEKGNYFQNKNYFMSNYY